LQGAASGILFVPVVIFILTSVPASTTTTGIAVSAFMRFMATLNSFVGLYTLQLKYNQLYKEAFLKYLTPNDPVFVDRLNDGVQFFSPRSVTPEQGSALAMSGIVRSLGAQQQLLTTRTVFLLYAVIILVIIFLILFITSAYKTNIYIRNMALFARNHK
jgi:DHA2 family multidrug resistance protein